MHAHKHAQHKTGPYLIVIQIKQIHKFFIIKLEEVKKSIKTKKDLQIMNS